MECKLDKVLKNHTKRVDKETACIFCKFSNTFEGTLVCTRKNKKGTINTKCEFRRVNAANTCDMFRRSLYKASLYQEHFGVWDF